MVRVDDRLIHGQVVAVWCRHQTFTRIVIVDDGVAADPFMRTVLELAAPRDLQIEVLATDDGGRVLMGEMPGRSTTMVLVRSPATALRLHKAGVAFDSLNVGGIAGGPGRKNVFRNIALSPDDFAALRDLTTRGVRVTLQTLPGERALDFAELSARG